MKRLFRSRENRMVAGIMGGVGEYLGIDPTVVRVGYFVIMFLTAVLPLVLLYLILYIIIPEQDIF